MVSDGEEEKSKLEGTGGEKWDQRELMRNRDEEKFREEKGITEKGWIEGIKREKWNKRE